MAPRRYIQRRRAETAIATRRAITRAAAGLYRERGIAATTFQAVAERADVARGTVANHFGTLDALVEAVLDEAVGEIVFPDEGALAGTATTEERVRRFVDVMFRFFDRSRDWWTVFADDREHPAVQARERQYEEVTARLYVAVFGDPSAARTAAAAVRAFVDYGPLHALLGSGLTLDEAIDVVGSALVAVVDRASAVPQGATGKAGRNETG